LKDIRLELDSLVFKRKGKKGFASLNAPNKVKKNVRVSRRMVAEVQS